ncbi:MAG: UDP-2,3-diacylglucosamine diphosphatase [Methylobacterium sp.]|nr:UDP-2,3-diacylglucosamine diphosphatase [Methylobacterium sp.]
MPEPEATRLRALFLSDLHLGTTGCQARMLLEFLRRYDADTIYLVGDIVDGWRLKSGWYWPQEQNDVVQKLLHKARKGARLIYIPGNHDEFLRDYLGLAFGEIQIVQRAFHEGADGQRYLVLHGDEFDVVVAHARWLALLGDWGYEFALRSNRIVNVVRRRLGLPYWSLSAWAKLKVKSAVNYIGNFEHFLANEARDNDAAGVICGHIHHAVDRMIEGVRYMNCGDWVESCTALTEDYDGTFRIIRFAEDLRAESLATARASSGLQQAA